jgi:hypothetical protein
LVSTSSPAASQMIGTPVNVRKNGILSVQNRQVLRVATSKVGPDTGIARNSTVSPGSYPLTLCGTALV